MDDGNSSVAVATQSPSFSTTFLIFQGRSYMGVEKEHTHAHWTTEREGWIPNFCWCAWWDEWGEAERRDRDQKNKGYMYPKKQTTGEGNAGQGPGIKHPRGRSDLKNKKKTRGCKIARKERVNKRALTTTLIEYSFWRLKKNALIGAPVSLFFIIPFFSNIVWLCYLMPSHTICHAAQYPPVHCGYHSIRHPHCLHQPWSRRILYQQGRHLHHSRFKSQRDHTQERFLVLVPETLASPTTPFCMKMSVKFMSYNDTPTVGTKVLTNPTALPIHLKLVDSTAQRHRITLLHVTRLRSVEVLRIYTPNSAPSITTHQHRNETDFLDFYPCNYPCSCSCHLMDPTPLDPASPYLPYLH